MGGDVDNQSELGSHLKHLREDAGLSLRALGNRIGMHHSYIARLEDGTFRPSPELLRRLADALEASYAALCNRAGYFRPNDMPSIGPYLRHRYHMPDDEVQKVADLLVQMGREPSEVIDNEIDENVTHDELKGPQ